jgi:PKD repeat protein
LPKTALSTTASIVLLAIFASPALAAPTADFSVSSGTLRTGVPVTFTSTSTAPMGSTITTQQWDFQSDGTFDLTGDEVKVTFANPGTRQVTLKVTSSEATDNQAMFTKQVTIVTRPPTADFSFNPSSPLVGDDVLFAPDAFDPDGDVLNYLWDFGDNSPTSTEHLPIHQFSSAGAKTVTLTVTDPHGSSFTATHDVVVRGVLLPGNQLPTARFAFSPRTARVGDPVEFVSSSFDSDGQVKGQAWDLNGDGRFDDAHGDDVIYTYTDAGPKTVRLQVTDSAGASAVAVRTITVKAVPKPKPGFLRPPPHVRFSGLIFSKGMRMEILGASGPRGALVTVRCSGKGCPVKQRRKRIKRGSVRFHSFERFLRRGIRLQFFVTKPNTIGTYRSYTIRAGKAPAIRNGCVTGTKLKRSRCPS